MKQSDERNIVFARMKYEKGTEIYEDYYNRNPQRKERDDASRQLPFMGNESSKYYHEQYSLIQDSSFEFLDTLHPVCDLPPNPIKTQGNAEDFTRNIKGLLHFYDAKLVGITQAKPELYYSHYGRPKDKYGKEVQTDYPTAIVFAYEMKKEMVFTSPTMPAAIAVTKGYVDAAVGGLQVCFYIRQLGYRARNNMDGNYLMPLVPLAVEAGLGALGFNGMLITKEYGSRLRLGAILTDLPLIHDEVTPFNIEDFCHACKRCAKYCPSKAIRPKEGGYFSDDNCFNMWQKLGTGCGICLAACPFSDYVPPHLMEKLDTSEGVKALSDYCDINCIKRPFIKENPEWLK